jgi:hypothetical protein
MAFSDLKEAFSCEAPGKTPTPMVSSNLGKMLEFPMGKRDSYDQTIGIFLKNLVTSKFLQQPLSIHLELTNSQYDLSIVTKKEMSSIKRVRKFI